nr:nucleotide-binding alpha-beta plait domain-containing protein [Tanacetum cinerariifolium]
MTEETALCQAWCDVSENNIDGNSMKSKGSWDAVIRIGAFCAIINNVEENHESGTNDLDVYHKACAEYKMMYKQDFTLEHYYNILKDHPGWTEVRRKNVFSAKQRGNFRSKEDDVARISTSVFISNIPDSITAMDLFHACSQYG